MQTEAKSESLDPHRWVVFGLIGSVYILVYFHRVSTSVIATDLLAVGGLSGGLGATLWATAQAKTPSAIMGLTSGLMNPFPLLGMAVMQGVTEAIVNRAANVGDVYAPEGYRNAFFILFLIAAACFVLCVIFRKRLSTERHGAQRRKPLG